MEWTWRTGIENCRSSGVCRNRIKAAGLATGARTTGGGAMVTILLADDDAAVRELVKRALTSDGHAVHAAEDGSEGLKLLDAHGAAISVIVTDLDMPGLDGISLAKEARTRNPDVAVIFMSAFSDQLDRAKALGPARIKSITKPFTLEQIKQIVRSVAG